VKKVNSQSSNLYHAQAFDSYAKKILKFAARDYYAQTKKRFEREMYFSELSPNELSRLAVVDICFEDEYVFDVLDLRISINDSELAEALKVLSPHLRNIVLLSYFLDMTDGEIAKLMNLANSTVAYRRTSTLSKLKRIMEELDDE
jgi:RNA polymerase sigma factor (sigma-70 family)